MVVDEPGTRPGMGVEGGLAVGCGLFHRTVIPFETSLVHPVAISTVAVYTPASADEPLLLLRDNILEDEF